jgi:hypothetical protein
LRKNNKGSDSTVICGIDFVTSTRIDADSTNDISVANMSLGGAGSDDDNCGNTNKDPLHQAICASVAAGVTSYLRETTRMMHSGSLRLHTTR